MAVSVEFVGIAEFQRAIDRLIARKDIATLRATELAAQTTKARMRANASQGSHAPNTPTPATPGSGPAIITGNLLQNITYDLARSGAFGYEARVGVRTGAPEAVHLERGAHGVRYPFIRPALVRARALFRELLLREWGRA